MSRVADESQRTALFLLKSGLLPVRDNRIMKFTAALIEYERDRINRNKRTNEIRHFDTQPIE